MNVSPKHSGFPESWEVLPFLDVFKDVTSKGVKVKKEDYLTTGPLPVVDQGQDLIGGFTDVTNKAIDITLPAIVFGDHTKIFKFIETEFAIGADGVKLLEPKVDACKKYLFFYLQQLQLEDAGYSRHFKFLKETYIPLPPLSTQKQIAAILEKADQLRKDCQQMEQELNNLAQSVFIDMFGDPVSNPKGWDVCSLGDLLEFAKDGPHVSPNYSENGIPFLSTRHVKPAGIVWEDLKFISNEEAEMHWKKCKPDVGDILYTKGGTTGIACPVDFKKDFAVWVHVALLRPKRKLTNYFWLSAMLNTNYCYMQSQKQTRGATNKDLGLTRMVNIEMYCPPLKLQNDYAHYLDKIRAELENIQTVSRYHEDAFHSLMQKAFSGELNLKHKAA